MIARHISPDYGEMKIKIGIIVDVSFVRVIVRLGLNLRFKIGLGLFLNYG